MYVRISYRLDFAVCFIGAPAASQAARIMAVSLSA
jgi:hypothetical protein